jgi:DNA-directed RNA polymerase subunit beta'
MVQAGNDFNAIRISLASPEQIKIWSYGEVTKPETINYRTLRPEKDGLFCERIFGPTKDWECYCGKYKKIRYKGVICDRCGVEVARSKVRRERMGRITLAAPVAHIWFSKGTPSRLGLMLDLSPRNLERVIYFAQYLVTSIKEDLRQAGLERLHFELEQKTEELEGTAAATIEELSILIPKVEEGEEAEEQELSDEAKEAQKKIVQINMQLEEDLGAAETDIETQIDELESLHIGQLLTETKYRELRDAYLEIFTAGMGAESVLEILNTMDLDAKRTAFQEEIRTTSGQRRKKAIKTLRVIEAFRKSGNKPDWMVLSVLPVLPPELRPMVQLDGGRFATSDLNDLYRRVINRNNRLKRLIDLQAPEIIIRNEKRMLQEAVDALIDNGRRGRAVSGSHNHKLKSLSDLLRGKQGRFRQNLLGKRVDYSGRSVITVGPSLRLDQCGLPRRMALELFKPFVMNKLVLNGYAHNIKSAKRLAERARPEVWDILEEVVKTRPVLLNRAPTLHRLGIQAFHPILVDGGSIKVHPLVCTAFNADFDGDQMAVHVPLSRGAVLEATQIMLSSKNMLSPSSGEPIVAPTLDMVLGCYYMTIVKENAKGTGRRFTSFEDVKLAYELGQIDLRALIKVRPLAEIRSGGSNGSANGDKTELVKVNGNGTLSHSDWLETTPGRIIFSDALPPELGFYNQELTKSVLKDITADCYRRLGNEGTMAALDRIKDLGFRYASKSGTTIAINDIEVPPEKAAIIANTEDKVAQLELQYLDGLITDDERKRNAIDIWTAANNELTQVIEQNLHKYRGIHLMATSGAKGNIQQIKQMAGMRGLMSNPKGIVIERPIKSNFREGLSVLEYFISTHGARKGLADTALRTADSGYLTRRLIDVAQEVVIVADELGTETGFWIPNEPDTPLKTPFEDRIKSRYVAEPVVHPETGEIILDAEGVIDEAMATKIHEAGVDGVWIYSPLACESPRGISSKAYGLSLANWQPMLMGEAVGIIAAQSIGEPGTQLTMRTFHTGGIAGLDITSGLPRVEELFEARTPKGEAVLSEIDGVVEVHESSDGRSINVISYEEYSDEYVLPEDHTVLIKDGDQVTIGDRLATVESEDDDDSNSLATSDVTARVSGTASITDGALSILWTDEDHREYIIPAASHIIVDEGQEVTAGEALTAGPKNPQQILRIQGREAVQNYLIEEVQKVYRSQGVTTHDKHIEVIAAQMLRKVRVDAPGDTELLPGELVDRYQFEEINAGILAEGGEPATASPVLLGITRASLNMDSFLAAASFQETTRVLTESAVNGDVDYLRGLKENVIIGRLIPARFDLTEEGRKRLGLGEDDRQEELVGVLTSPTQKPHRYADEEADDDPLGEPMVVAGD